jgi:hypothetical protein
MLGMEYVSQGHDDLAIQEFYQLTIDTNPYVPAYHMAAQALVRMGRETEAVPLLQQGIRVARQRGDHHAAGEMEGLLLTIQ